MRYLLKSDKEYQILEKAIVGLGIDFCKDWQGDINRYPYAAYEEDRNKIIGYKSDEGKTCNTLGEFIGYVTDTFINRPKKLEYHLNSKYKAEYIQGSETIKVGCQNFYVSDIRTLLQQIDELNKE